MKLKIARLQYFAMIPNLVYGKAIGITSGVFVRVIGADTWTSMLIGFAAGVLAMAVIAFLGTKFPEKTVIQYAQELLGKWTAKVLGLLLAAFFLVAYALSADVMVMHLCDYFLPETPILVICIIYTLLAAYGAWVGFEVISRISLIGLLMLIALNITMLIGVAKDFHLINLLPLMEKGITANITDSVYVFSDIAMAVLAVGILLPSLRVKDKAVSISIWSMVVTAVLVVGWPLMETGVMGQEIMKKYVVVCMEQIRCVQLTKYFPRSELLMVSFFVFSMYVQSTAMLHCSKYCMKQITGIKKDWIILLPIAAAGLFLSHLFVKDENNFVNFLTWPWPQICLVLTIGIPLLLVLAALLRGRLKKTGGAGTEGGTRGGTAQCQ